ncbi:MAG: 2-hydroxyglutaryl-CoA dehydratase [Planctomycetes bacterium]|nr:2-hydroxyglutaryl-CoA dehydratase [Planctomycetota bacterium]
MIGVGIDAGSRAVKICLVDANSQETVTEGVVDQGVQQDKLVTELLEDLLSNSRLQHTDIARIVATGYGRNRIDSADTTITEITCHAAGVRHRVPDAMTVIDIGGQDSKFLRLTPEGAVRDFAMNDRCAAGTGCFLEVVSSKLGVNLADLGILAHQSQNPAVISSMCVVFAETEIIGLLSEGTPPKDIIAGVQHSIASRVAGMAGKNADEPVVFTGGVALIRGMDQALADTIGKEVTIAPDPQMTGALGAAILAIRQLNQ